MDHGRAGGAAARSRTCAGFAGAWRAASRSASRVAGSARSLTRPARRRCRPALRAAVARGARRRRSGSAGRPPPRRATRCRATDARELRLIAPAHLAVLRDLRDAGREQPAPRQLPGGPAAGRRAPDLAHQHRPLSPVGHCRARLRLGRRPARPSSGWRRRSRPSRRCPSTGATSSTGIDTRDLRVLDPPYVSSVDSGNLAGHLIALANACEEWARAPLPDPRPGLRDALRARPRGARRPARRPGGRGRGACSTRSRRVLAGDQPFEALAAGAGAARRQGLPARSRRPLPPTATRT